MFDVLTVAALADELTETALDGRIQRVGQLDARTIAAEVYAGRKRRYLIASADNDHPRLLMSETEPSFDTDLVTPFLLLLRKYVRGGYLVGIEQPPLERVLHLSIAKRRSPHNGASAASAPVEERTETADEDDEEDLGDGLADATFVHLYVEIMGRHSNLILVDDEGRIMESVKRVTSTMSRVRPVLPRRPYSPPPPPTRPDPRRLTTVDAELLFSRLPPSTQLARALTQHLRAISPQMAREIAFRVSGRSDITVEELASDDAQAASRVTRELFEPLLTSTWAPVVYRNAESDVVAFSPVPMQHLAADFTEEPVTSVSRAAELAAGDEERTPVRHGQRRERLSQAALAARTKVESRRDALQVEAEKSAQGERFREWGETIYAYLWSIKPGQQELEADGVVIPLDPALSANENAQAYFARYRKAQSAGGHLPDLIAQADTELAYLDQLRTLIAHAERFDDLETLAQEWDAYQRASGRIESNQKRPRRSTPPRRTRPMIDDAGNAIYIGRSGAENDLVTFEIAGPDDTWFHARGVPGSHVIVRWRDSSQEENADTLERAASLAAFYSSARNSGAVEVDATRRRHVRKIKGAGPGMVTYRNERTLSVRPRDERALGLETGSKK